MSSTATKIQLDSSIISTSLASKLAITFVENVLFLKNQIPFPVSRLANLPTSRSDKRSLKLRQDMLDSFDLLSSHLHTTFGALSTSVAKCKRRPRVITAYMLILLGPSLSHTAARSKLVLALDSLAVKIWGERECHDEYEELGPDVSDSEEESGDEEDEYDNAGINQEEEKHIDERRHSSSSGSSDVNNESISPASSLLPSPARSPTVSSASLHTTYESPSSEAQISENRVTRLLARALTAGLDDGEGVGEDLPPTQTHVLILAPRKFNHPAWIPRQQFGSARGVGRGVLDDFWKATGDSPSSKQAKSIPTQGVWIQARGPETTLDKLRADSDEENDVEEDDEMIWWSWDGKVVGFSNW